MSGWEPYIAAMVQVGVTHGCIMALKDGALWGATEGFTLDNYEVEVLDDSGVQTLRSQMQEHPLLLHLAKNEGNPPDAFGIYLGHKKYYRVNFDPDKRSIYLKSKDGYACIACTATAFVYGSVTGAPPGPLNERIEYLAQQLINSGL